MTFRIALTAAAVACSAGAASAQLPKGFNTWSFEGGWYLQQAIRAEQVAADAAAAAARSAAAARPTRPPTPPVRVTITLRPPRIAGRAGPAR